MKTLRSLFTTKISKVLKEKSGPPNLAALRENGPDLIKNNGKKSVYRSIFSFDGLYTDPRVIHNHDFMQDQKYIDAFSAGYKALAHDHSMFWRLHTALFFANRALKLEGDFVECGVWKGFLSRAIMNYIDWNNIDKNFYLFDSFEGLSESYLTTEELKNKEKLAHLASHYNDCYEDAKNTFKNFQNVHLIKGYIPETLEKTNIEKVCYLSLDMNCAMPELAAAEYFWDRMSPSAAIILDDYGFVSYEEQKRVFKDFAKRKKTEILHMPTGQGIILKP
jgi:hypothetical protein